MTSPTEDPPPLEVQAHTGGTARAGVTVATALGVVLLFGTVFLGRLVRAPPLFLTVAVTLLPYLWLGAMAWIFTLWSVLPDRKVPPVLLAAVVLLGAGLWGPSWAARGERATGEPLTVMTWNLRRLWGGPADGADPAQCVVDAIALENPDVITLLEVSLEDVEKLGNALDLRCVHATYRESTSAKKGGLASCVRGSRWHLNGGSGLRFVDHEDWFYVFSEVQRAGEVFNVLAVHLHPYELHMNELKDISSKVVRAQSDQSAALLARVEKFKDPTLVAGDFNSTRDAALHSSLRKHLTDAWERGGFGFGGTVDFFDIVPLRVDYVYASDDFAVVDARVPKLGCSDHRPVVTRLLLRGARPDPP